MCLQRRERLPRSHSVAPLDGGHPANLHGALPRRRVEHPPAQHAAPAGLARSLGGVSRIHGSDSVSPRRYARLQLFCYLNSWRLWTTRRAASERLNITHLIEETHESPSSRAPRPISPGERRCHSTTSDELTDGCGCVGVAAAVEAVESGGDGRGSTVRPVRLPPRQPRQPHHLSTSPSLRGWPAVAMMGATVRPRPHEVVCEEGKSERERERERELCSPAARGH
jgi:hypothetical protein